MHISEVEINSLDDFVDFFRIPFVFLTYSYRIPLAFVSNTTAMRQECDMRHVLQDMRHILQDMRHVYSQYFKLLAITFPDGFGTAPSASWDKLIVESWTSAVYAGVSKEMIAITISLRLNTRARTSGG